MTSLIYSPQEEFGSLKSYVIGCFKCPHVYYRAILAWLMGPICIGITMLYAPVPGQWPAGFGLTAFVFLFLPTLFFLTEGIALYRAYYSEFTFSGEAASENQLDVDLQGAEVTHHDNGKCIIVRAGQERVYLVFANSQRYLSFKKRLEASLKLS